MNFLFIFYEIRWERVEASNKYMTIIFFINFNILKMSLVMSIVSMQKKSIYVTLRKIYGFYVIFLSFLISLRRNGT